MSTIEIVSVRDGKFHRPDSVAFNGNGNDFRDARLMRCGRSLVPLNFFETIADADKYTGGRLERYICQQCERKVVKQETATRHCTECGLLDTAHGHNLAGPDGFSFERSNSYGACGGSTGLEAILDCPKCR